MLVLDHKYVMSEHHAYTSSTYLLQTIFTSGAVVGGFLIHKIIEARMHSGELEIGDK